MPYTTELAEDEMTHFSNVEIAIPEETMVKLWEGGIERIDYMIEFNVKDVTIIDDAFKEAWMFSAYM